MAVKAAVESHELRGTLSDTNLVGIGVANQNIKKQRCLKVVLPGLALFLLVTIFVVLTTHKPRIGAPLATVGGKNLTKTYCDAESPKVYNQSQMGNKSELDPCEDFYEFACKKWQLNNPNSTSVFEKLYKEEMELVSVILGEPIHQGDMHFLNEAKLFFKQCLIKSELQICVSHTRILFWWALTHEIVLRRYTTKEEFSVTSEPVLQMFLNVKSSLEEMRSPLYSNTTPCIGIPEWIFDRNSVESTYKGFSDGAQWVRHRVMEVAFQNAFGLTISTRMLDLECQWDEDVGLAYYRRSEMVSQTFFPYIILQSPFYDSKRSNARNYGALGAVQGHELVHSYTSNYWNQPKDEPMSQFIDCLKRQYSSFNVEVSNNKLVNVNGESTAKENFADNWGLRGAYQAYLKLEQNNTDAILTSSMHLRDSNPEQEAGEQEFFLSFAQIWCESKQKEQRMDAENVHSPASFRVIGTLQNFPEFSKAYKCPLGSKMNPCQDKKCLLF